MIKPSDIKQITRNKLAGKWKKAYIITILFVTINLILTYTSNLIIIFTTTAPILHYSIQIIFTIILLPIAFGYISSIVKLLNGKNPEYTEIINDSLLNASKSIGIFLRIFVKILLPTVLSGIIVTALLIFTYIQFHITINTFSGFLLLAIFLYFIVIIIATIFSIPYSLSNYALANDNSLTSKEAIKKSVSLMNGNKWNFVILILSFFILLIPIGFLITILQKYTPVAFHKLIEAIGTIIILPYIIASIAVFYEELNDVKIETIEKKEE